MRFRNLSEAIEMVNETGYGLTSGLESLDDREQSIWLSGIRAGNLYVNRPTTGAIVLRQPFGGMGKSAFGPGIKAGGPNYVTQLMNFVHVRNEPMERASEDIENPVLRQLAEDLLRVAVGPDHETLGQIEAIRSFDQAASDEFLRQHDHFRLIGQDNFRRYLPIIPVCIRVDEQDSWTEIVLRAAAVKSVGGRSIISASATVHPKWIRLLHDLTESWAGDIEFVQQTDKELAETIEWGGLGRVRYASNTRVPMSIRRAVIGRYVHITDVPVLPVGRIELLWYVQEQSISNDYHRYGNLGARSDEQRRPTN
jgi:RHH-type proline utilization regulon transcriptional repressor/proline dehydrogenase/delta 1-pyrroline-5-carboxylate dehydrogenase